MSGEQAAKILKDYAREIGLAALAIGPADPLGVAEDRLKARIAKGYMGHYGFAPGAESKFCHPEELLPGAKSIISVALSYLRPSEPPPRAPGELTGQVARFARGRDYHTVIREKMELIAARLQELIPGSSVRLLNDTGPLLDRAAAAASGLGWYGKNACFFVPDFGSWVVLGEIITGADLPRDPPYEGHKCGSCELCLAACPTGAIRSPFEVDLNRCISHLTQMSGIIPRELRHFMGNMVYGCDICQEVCPQNEGARPGNPEDFEPGALAPTPDLVRLLQMTNAEFHQTLAHGSAGWIGRNRLRRNACVALGNLKDTSAVPALRKAMHDKSASVRAHAAWALGEIGGEDACRILENRLKYEPDPDAITEIQQALSNKQGVGGAK